MKYGYFDDANREYVITNPHTPVKWINYIGTLDFGGFVDHTGGLLICKDDPALNRITRYLAVLPAADLRGSTLYVRVKTPAGYRVFSAYYTPTLEPYESYECHVGLGYTRIITVYSSEFYRLRIEATFFVPPGEPVLVQDIRITNLGDNPLEVDAVPVVEYTHFDALKQLTNADWVPQTMQSKRFSGPEGDTQGDIILAQYAFMKRDTAVNYFTSNLVVSSFETDRKRFLGNNEYGSWAQPFSLQQDELSNSEALRGDNIAALLHHLDALPPGESRRLITLLGQAQSVQAAGPLIRQYRQGAQVDAAFQRLAAFWQDYLSRLQVETPDASLNSMLNIHNPHQCYITKQWSRYLSLYQLGYGARGIGFRDSSQDVMAVLASAPQEGKVLMRKLLSVQKCSGRAMHQFNPLTMIAESGDSGEVEGGQRYYSDDHLWIVLAVTAYIKETGDLSFLEEAIPYYEKDENNRPIEAGSVLDHLQRAVDFTQADVGAHQLPLLGFADWNDTVNLRAGAESLFTAHLYGLALLELEVLYQHLGDPARAQQCRAAYEAMREHVNQQGWDGEWYVRYFDCDGTPLGSKSNTHGQIYLNGQSWAVLSGFATPERAEKAMEAVHQRLNTAKGIKLSAPGFNGFDPTKGGVTTYPPGAKENGGIFLHTNPWAVIAETLLGHGERAYEYYSQINPAAKNEHIDEFECEPYVYPQNILADEHPQFGLARNSWLTGTASWAYQAGTQYILGIRPTYQGLLVDPCIPAAWDGFKVRRRFRNAVYEIQVHNPQHVSKGVVRLMVDGRESDGNTIPIFTDEQSHSIEAWLG